MNFFEYWGFHHDNWRNKLTKVFSLQLAMKRTLMERPSILRAFTWPISPLLVTSNQSQSFEHVYPTSNEFENTEKDDRSRNGNMKGCSRLKVENAEQNRAWNPNFLNWFSSTFYPSMNVHCSLFFDNSKITSIESFLVEQKTRMNENCRRKLKRFSSFSNRSSGIHQRQPTRIVFSFRFFRFFFPRFSLRQKLLFSNLAHHCNGKKWAFCVMKESLNVVRYSP